MIKTFQMYYKCVITLISTYHIFPVVNGSSAFA